MAYSYLNTIQNADCLDFLPKLEQESVDCAIYDIPYYTSKDRQFTFKKNGKNIRKAYSTDLGEWDHFESKQEYFKWVRMLVQATLWVLKPNGSLYLFCKDEYISKFKTMLEEEGYLSKNIIIWAKTNPMQNVMHLNYNTTTEWQIFAIRNDKNAKSMPCIFNWLNQRQIHFPRSSFPPDLPPFELNMHNIITASICMKPERVVDLHDEVVHPSQKPIEILLRPILVSSNPNGIVLDATCGVGSTCEAAKLLKRQWIGCEISQRFRHFAEKRLHGLLEKYDLSSRLKYIIRKLNDQNKSESIIKWLNAEVDQ